MPIELTERIAMGDEPIWEQIKKLQAQNPGCGVFATLVPQEITDRTEIAIAVEGNLAAQVVGTFALVSALKQELIAVAMKDPLNPVARALLRFVAEAEHMMGHASEIAAPRGM